MKKTKILSACSLVALLALSLLPATPAVLAHSITVDGDPSDWSMAAPTTPDTGHVGRNSSVQGEYIWTDTAGDERTDFADPDDRVDITQVRVTGDDTYIYFLIRMGNIDIGSGDGVSQVQIAIDTDQVSGNGNTSFGGNASTEVASNGSANWEYLVRTNFGSGSATPTVWNSSWNDVAGSGNELEAISTANDVIEIRVRQSVLGGISFPTRLRFTIASFRANGSDDVWWPDGSSNAAMDCVTNYGDPGSMLNTWDEVVDGDVDYYFDTYFHSSGEVIAPLLISEFIPNPSGTDTDREWIQVYNAWDSDVSLVGWKLGDASTPGESSEGMAEFPSGTISSGGVVVVARRANTGSDGFDHMSYGCAADFEFIDTNATPNMENYGPWTTASNNQIELQNSDDEVLLLDPQDTVVDVVVYGGGSYPGVVAHTAPGDGDSLERYPANTDSNDGSSDFRVVGSNGTPCNIPTAVDLVSFTATPRRGDVWLRWETATEIDTLGFNLYRAESRDGPRVRLNENLIPGQAPGSPVGGTYTWRDTNVQAGGTYYYWLEDVDVYGRTTLHGPVSAKIRPRQKPAPAPRIAPGLAPERP